MRSIPALLACLAVMSARAADAPAPGEAVKLEYKLQPGMDLRYTLQVSFKQSGAGRANEGNYTNTVRVMVCDVDAKGVMLLGRLMTMEMKGATAGVSAAPPRMVSASRLDRSGKPVPRQAPEKEGEDDAKNRQKSLARGMLRQFEDASLVRTALPEKAVKPGDKWETEVKGGMYSNKSKCEATLAEIKVVDGRQCAVLKSKLSPVQEAGGFQSNSRGEEEVLFDTERGLPIESKYTMDMSFGAGGQMKMELGLKLDALRTMPADELAANQARVKALDSALAEFAAGETDKAIESVNNLRAADKDSDWQQGLDQLLVVGQSIKTVGAQGEEEFFAGGPKTPEEKAFADAGTQAAKGKFKEAADAFKSFAEKYPEHKLAPQALLAAAQIHEQNLNDKASADQARKTLVALREKAAAKDAAKDPLEWYKLASSYAEAGENQKAIDTYKKFIASDAKDARMRVLAQYRVAGLLEKMGQKREALEAYRAVDSIQSDDAYARQLKDRAKVKVAELGK
ncbi:MAG: tetratricopeptide repeat protein [Planctomycetota bacterium]|nr:tetratricopeptide repeat protein [Planctomycetota bacterium]